MFTTKDEYLAWTAKWKADYAYLSKEIRDYKAARKVGSDFERSMAQRAAQVARGEARQMLETRKEAKALSWSLKQALLVK